MDEWVARSVRRRAEAQRTDEASLGARRCRNPWVRLTGLRTESLNGSLGIRGVWDAEKGRWDVQLRELGKSVLVKPENMEVLPDSL